MKQRKRKSKTVIEKKKRINNKRRTVTGFDPMTVLLFHNWAYLRSVHKAFHKNAQPHECVIKGLGFPTYKRIFGKLTNMHCLLVSKKRESIQVDGSNRQLIIIKEVNC